MGSLSINYILHILVALAIQLRFVTSEQIQINAITPTSKEEGSPNTFVTTSDLVAASLLGSATPVMLWGAISVASIGTACDAIVQRGTFTFDADIQGSWGGSEQITLQVSAVGGCNAAPDQFGTQFVFMDNYSRRTAVVCPHGAAQTGCAVYMAGHDIDLLYNTGKSLIDGGNKLTKKVIPLDCRSGAGGGAIGGAVTGILTTNECWELGFPLGAFCAAGVMGAVIMLRAAAGCVRESCFPGNAKVELVGGQFRTMNHLQLGDKVAVLRNGHKVYEDVYAFGHRDHGTLYEFTRIQMMSSVSNEMILELSKFHFIPSVTDRGSIKNKRAGDIQFGDMLLASSNKDGDGLVVHRVTNVSTVLKAGLFNPFTLGGTIIVNGVVASVHSEWFLDVLFETLGIPHLLPHAYQILLLPARCIYYLLGKEAYTSLYTWLDSTYDIAGTGTKYGGVLCMLFVAVLAATIHLGNK